tara:strand:- start:25 stop:1638 length:1614 start_codon:yes stop_codon:yes gene_type:complete
MAESNSLLSSLEKRLNNVVESTEPQKDFTGFNQYDPMHVTATLLGESAGAVGDVVGETLSATVGWAVPDFVKNFVNQSAQGVLDSDTGKAVASWADENPKEWQQVKNVVNIFTVGTGGSLLKQGAKENKGAWASGVSNYIKNHYTPDKTSATRLESLLGEGLLKVKGEKVTPFNSAGAGKKVTGFGEWAAESAVSMFDSFLNPSSRALYAETGINKQSQKKVKKILDNPDSTPRDIEKAMAQAIYNRHIVEQSGRQGNIGSSLIDVEDFSTVQGYKPLNIESFQSGVKATKTELNGKRQYTAPKDAKKAYEHITQAWGLTPDRPTKVIFKEPSGGASGNHLQDFAFKNPVNKIIRGVLSSFPKRPSTEKMYKELLNQASKKNSPFKVLSKSSKDVAENGLWVQSSFVGNAVVEGGVNAIYKVLPNGRVTAYMSDVHNFLEKIPVVGKGIEKALPTDVLAIAGPMHIDIMNNKWARKKTQKQGKEFKEKAKPKTEKTKDRGNAREILTAYANARPDNLGRGLQSPLGVGLMTARSREE